MLVASWLAYVGWSYCPHKLATLAELQNALRAP